MSKKFLKENGLISSSAFTRFEFLTGFCSDIISKSKNVVLFKNNFIFLIFFHFKVENMYKKIKKSIYVKKIFYLSIWKLNLNFSNFLLSSWFSFSSKLFSFDLSKFSSFFLRKHLDSLLAAWEGFKKFNFRPPWIKKYH